MQRSWVQWIRDGLAPTDGPYADNPTGYAADVLGVDWWSAQRRIAESVRDNPVTMVRSAHSVGKTFVGGGLVNWFYDQFSPGITITTAPGQRQVDDLLWKEIRLQRPPGDTSLYPRAARMQDRPNHYAVGYTAVSSTSFQGTHEQRLFIVVDEAVGVSAEIMDAIDGMLTSGPGNRLLLLYNPTDPASAVYDMESDENANLIVVSALEHPNVELERRGDEPRYASAVHMDWITRQFKNEERATPIEAVDAEPGDIEWPPDSGQWYRPGFWIETRVLARWPTSTIGAVWSEAAFTAAEEASLPIPKIAPQIGCDVARQGDDNTVMHVRQGSCSLHHESHNGWNLMQTTGRIIDLAGEYGRAAGVDRRKVKLLIDDDGLGGGVTDRLAEQKFNVFPVNAGTNAIESDSYPNRRSELWFTVVKRARERRLDLSRLPGSVRANLRRQCLAPLYTYDSEGRRVVEPKEKTKKRVKRSPDDADAMNLAYAAGVRRRRFRASSVNR